MNDEGIQRWLLWIISIIICGTTRWKSYCLWRNYIFLSLLQEAGFFVWWRMGLAHQQVCGFIWQYVEDNVYNHIANETYARTLWKKIESLYASNSRNNKLNLLNCLINLRYMKNSSILDYLNEFQGFLY